MCSRIATQHDAEGVQRSKIKKSISIHKMWDVITHLQPDWENPESCNTTILHGYKAQFKTEMNQSPYSKQSPLSFKKPQDLIIFGV